MAIEDRELQTTVLLIECARDVPECRVHFEPEGADHLLRAGDHFRIEAVLPRDYKIEVMYGPGSISVWAEQTWGTRAFTSDGRELKL
jgi:hypothetical protein